MKIEYVAFDGARFASEENAREHEQELLEAHVKPLVRSACEEFPDQYELIVVFQRSIGDDVGLVQKQWPGKSLQDALIQQLAEELQEAYDNARCLAGHFQILPVVIGLEKCEQ